MLGFRWTDAQRLAAVDIVEVTTCQFRLSSWSKPKTPQFARQHSAGAGAVVFVLSV